MQKTNLSGLYSTDKTLENEGKWFDIGDVTKFKMKRMGGANSIEINKLRSKYIKPHLRQIEKDILPKDVEAKLYVKVFVESCMVGWEGLLDENNEEIPYSKETANDLFNGTPDLFDLVVSLATDIDSYKEDLGKY